MATEIRTYQVTIPAGTADSAPYTESITFPPRVVTAIRWRVPPGPSGLMGWRLEVAGQSVIPRIAGTWIIADNESTRWELSGYPDQGKWTFAGYNTDLYDHSVYMDFELDVIGGQALPVTAPNPAVVSLTSASVT